MKITYVEGIGMFAIVLTQDGEVTFFRHFNDLEHVETLRFPTDDGLAFAPSFIDATDEYHFIPYYYLNLYARCILVAGYRGSMLLGPICRPTNSSYDPCHIRSSLPSRTIDFDGVLLHARVVRVSQAIYVLSVTHNDNGEESGVVMHKVIENRKTEFLTSFKLPRGKKHYTCTCGQYCRLFAAKYIGSAQWWLFLVD